MLTNSSEALPISATPAGGDHAVDTVAVGVEWGPGMEFATFSSILAQIASLPAVRGVLSFERRFPALEITMQEDGAGVKHPQGYVADYVDVEGDAKPEWLLSIRPEVFAISCTKYRRWAQFKPKTLDVLNACIPIALNAGAKIQAIGLQYADAFNWPRGRLGNPSEILRAGSTLVPASVFSRESFWHSHNGWFSEMDPDRRVLNSVNVDYGGQRDDQGGFNYLRILGQHKVLAAHFSSSEALELSLSQLDQFLEILHRSNKLALQDLLCDEALGLIKMEKIEA